MVGQGGPPTSQWRRSTSATRRWRCALAWLVAWAASTALAGEPLSLRLRIAWGGGAGKRWQGSLRVEEGTLEDVRVLGIEADEPGSIWTADGAVFVEQRSARTYDGLDVTVSGQTDSQLRIALAAGDGEEATIAIPLADLLHESRQESLDGEHNRILVARAPGDKLRVELPDDALVFAPGQKVAYTIRPHALGLPAGTPLKVRAQLVAAGSGTKLSTVDYDTAVDDEQAARPIAAEFVAPPAEGVYELVLAAATARLADRVLWKKPLVERKLQFVVVSDQALDPPARAPDAVVVEIDPANPHWWERLSNLPLPGWRKGPLGHGTLDRWEHPKLGMLAQLGGAHAGDTAWEAYPLPLTQPGQPHLLEIEYPSDVPQTLGISIVEPNAAGAVAPIGLDSGVYVSDEEAEGPAVLLKHRLVFWPRTKSPLVLVTNRRATTQAVYGKIRVLGPAAPPKATLTLPWTAGPATSGLPPAALPDAPDGRTFAAYFHRPLFAENFGAPESQDPPSKRSLDDWSTFYYGGTRLVEYLRHVGYNAAFVSVWAEGGAIYPSRVLEATPRFDTGIFFASGQDPHGKDALELLFRLFDRSGVQLVPVLHFTAPLPELESLLRENRAEAHGIEPIGADGRTWLQTHPPRQGQAPYYNPLHPRVAAAMQNVVRELVDRYGRHPSFGGLAIELAADGYAQLPGADWGFDDVTLARFQRETGTRLSSSAALGSDRFAARAKLLLGQHRKAWIDWRATALATLHRQLYVQLVRARPDARLYLTAGELLDHPYAVEWLRPTLPPKAKAKDVLLAMGLAPEAYRADDGLIFLRPQRLVPTDLATTGADLEFNLSGEVDYLFAGAPHPGGQFFHEQARARLPSFDAQSPFGANNTFTWLAAEMSPSADRNRRRFAHAVAALDAEVLVDGGWLLPLGQEDALADLLSVFRRLPAARFQSVPGDCQPITIRTLVQGEQTWAYLVNDSPWSVDVAVDVDAPANCRVEKVGNRGVGPLARSGQGLRWRTTLKPYELAAARFTAPDVRLSNPRATVAGRVHTALQQRIKDLGARAAALGSLPPLPVLHNAGFEGVDAQGQLPDWTAASEPGATAEPDTREFHSGSQSLRLASDGPPATIKSNAFAPPTTGRITVELWLKAAAERQPPLRLAVEGKLDDRDFYRYAPVGSAGQSTVPLTGQWAPYIFQIDDLPSAGLGDLRVRFDLEAAGEVWIDDVQVFDLAFSDSERIALAQLISQANFELLAGHLGNCAQLLEGYWPQYLLANVPLAQGPGGAGPRRVAAQPARVETLDEKEKRPGVFDKVRRIVPRLR